jgi:hypothetical protein
MACERPILPSPMTRILTGALIFVLSDFCPRDHVASGEGKVLVVN